MVKLAKYLKIPENIITKAPSAGLYLNQTDESEMGITYKELDAMLAGEKKKSKIVLEMIRKSEHKRHIPKICKL